MADFFLIAALVVLGVYTLFFAAMTAGLFRRQPTRVFETPPRVSVVVAARNEEKNIGRCLESLIRLDYPAAHLEIIIADGASEDRTRDIVKRFIESHPSVRLVEVDQNRRIKGKGNAIHQGIAIATGEYVFLTDADCTVQPAWIKQMLAYYTDDTGLVCSTTLPNARSLFSAMQAVEWCHVLSSSSAIASLGAPIGGIGNNFTFRKRVYEEVGGYENIRFSVTEDFALFQAILKTGWRVAYPLRFDTHNSTEAMPTIAELYEQKKRWTLGGLDANLKQSVLAALIFTAHLFTVLAFVVLPIPAASALFGAKCLVDFLYLLTPLVKLRRLPLLFVFPLFEVYYFVFVMLVPVVIVFSRKVVWKGITYEAKSETA